MPPLFHSPGRRESVMNEDNLSGAVDLLNSGRLEDALAAGLKVLHPTSPSPQAVFLVGETLRRLGRAAEAEPMLARAASAMADADPMYRLGLARLALGRAGDAIEPLHGAVNRDPGNLQHWFNLGTALHQAGRLLEAANLFQQAGERFPDTPVCLKNAGVLYHQAGETAKAEQIFRALATAAPDNPEALSNLVSILLEQKRMDAALAAVREHIARQPEQRDLVHTLLNTLRLDEKFQEARDFCTFVLDCAPGSPDMLDQMGLIAGDQHRIDESVRYHRQCVDAAPNDANYAMHLGMALRRQRNFEEAEQCFRRSLNLNPDLEDAHIGLAALLHDNGRLDEAVDALDVLDSRPGREGIPKRSAVIAVLDYSPGSPHNIRTLLDDLAEFDGEVICVFNGDQVYEDLRNHPRIDKYSYNRHNVGVGRAWNIGINQAEGETIFILNADLKLTTAALADMERYLLSLPDALVVGPSGDWLDPVTVKATEHVSGPKLTEPVAVDQVSGHCFALHAHRLHDEGISFDPRLSPYFLEEADLGLKARSSGLKAYVVPVSGIEHVWGISRRDRPILCFGRPVNRLRCMVRNTHLIRRKYARDWRADPTRDLEANPS